ncbi:hypothetical protein HKX48_005631 [Thoreauomyces humboldtii]|nr:hypothetical protein HKX48_005631 [Thoreauomyces humboldtii]
MDMDLPEQVDAVPAQTSPVTRTGETTHEHEFLQKDAFSVANLLHPLALNTYALKAEFDALRDEIVARGGPAQIPASGQTVDILGIPLSVIRRRLQDKAFAQDPLYPLRSALDDSFTDALRDHRQSKKPTSADAVTKKLQTITDELQLQLYSAPQMDDEMAVTDTICGKIFVVDLRNEWISGLK